MRDYSKGKTYRVNCKCGCNKVYVGSTIQTLRQRKNKHRADFNQYTRQNLRSDGSYLAPCITVFEILEHNDYEIVLIEDYPCNNAKELKYRERYWFENITCVNKVCPIRSKDEIKTLQKEYNKENIDKLREQARERAKKYYKLNPDKFKAKAKEDREKYKDYYKNYKKKYSESHREIRNESRRKNIVECPECSKEINKENLKRHIEEIHHNQKVKCNECEKEICKSGMKRHMTRIHQIT
jgi:hypothetical protein